MRPFESISFAGNPPVDGFTEKVSRIVEKGKSGLEALIGSYNSVGEQYKGDYGIDPVRPNEPIF